MSTSSKSAAKTLRDVKRMARFNDMRRSNYDVSQLSIKTHYPVDIHQVQNYLTLSSVYQYIFPHPNQLTNVCPLPKRDLLIFHRTHCHVFIVIWPALSPTYRIPLPHHLMYATFPRNLFHSLPGSLWNDVDL